METMIAPISTVQCTVKTEIGYKESLLQLLSQLGDLNQYEQCSCSFVSPYFTLVPSALFASSKPEELLQFTVEHAVPKGETDYNRLPEWNLVVIYQMPLWVKSALVVKMPRIVIQHELAHVLRHMNTGSTIPLKTQIILQENTFSIVIRKEGLIAHASVQEYQNAEDILYHLMICYKRLEITTKSQIALSSSTDEANIISEKVIELSKKVQDFSIHTFQASTHSHLQFQALCV
jgi:hypothetical protein